MTANGSAPRRAQQVRQLRVVLRVEDFDQAMAFYREALGLGQEVVYPGEGDQGQVALLEAGRATLELVNAAQAMAIDVLEGVTVATAPTIRLAFEVDDCRSATADLVAAGATLIAAPTETPWGSLNARLDGPGDVQL
ncbi:MAG: VOC family protein, partial [Nocardioidaceae bacterium]